MYALVFDADKCVGCGLCVECCPFGAITLSGGRPSADGRCHMCMACVNACPADAITEP